MATDDTRRERQSFRKPLGCQCSIILRVLDKLCAIQLCLDHGGLPTLPRGGNWTERRLGWSNDMTPDDKSGMDASLLGEIQVILAEKRTALALMRTGIAVFVLPLSVLSVLIATSKYYDVLRVLYFLLPLLVLNLG